ncbi:hypothetical protein [Flavivirga rizhaonensis]|uniref:Uncharacterized protein n=1 Tax=Flavivirga rizhaonensis TaxID=2559571 RepID=A0A4V3P4Z9_9FLAO|nr:hypothetical protein [Flavivirga rizhaonensis]TGV03384.1 hypothetical protein EM932_06845 [Flavivirga rizhaonensis]
MKYISLVLFIVLFSCNNENEFSPENLDKILSLSIENDGALANGIEEVRVVAEFPNDFTTEDDKKVEFEVFKKSIETIKQDIELVQENSVQRRQASILITHNEADSLRVKATISVNDILISKDVYVHFSEVNLDDIMQLSIENDNALANGIEEVKVIAAFPDDFTTEEDGKVKFEVFKNPSETIEQDIELVQENGVQRRQASLLIKHNEADSLRVKATISVNDILISKEVYVHFSEVNLDDIMQLSIENDNALANGVEDIRVIASFPDDFTTEQDGKVDFQVFKNTPENSAQDIQLVQENGILSRQASIEIKHNKEGSLRVKATISVNEILITKEVNINFSKAYFETINVSSSTLKVQANLFNEIDIFTKLLRDSGTVSLNSKAETVVKDTLGEVRGVFNNYQNKTDSEGKITNKFTLGNDDYVGKLFVIGTSIDEMNEIKSDTLTIYSQN